jgi:hypothetical protein
VAMVEKRGARVAYGLLLYGRESGVGYGLLFGEEYGLEYGGVYGSSDNCANATAHELKTESMAKGTSGFRYFIMENSFLERWPMLRL